MNSATDLFKIPFTGQCLLLCVALETANYWSASIGPKRINNYTRAYIYANRWTTKLSYVCQYHSKSLHHLHGLNLL